MIDKAIDYVRQNIDMDEVERTIGIMWKTREPLYVANHQLCNKIMDLLEEYGSDNDYPEGWWMNYMDEEEVLFKL